MQIFKNFPGERDPDPPRIILVSLFASNLTLPEKKTLKKCQKLVQKSSEYTPLTWTYFLKGFQLFFGFNIYAFT